MIEVSNITKQYDKFFALKDISFKVDSGEVVGLLGPNGAGKTTLIRILTGYHYPTSGLATVYGQDVVQAAQEAKQRIGYLPENAPIYQDMQVHEYLRFIARARGVPKRQIPAQIQMVVAQCALESVLLKSIQNISKGYRQRVGIAQAMIHNPHILILDEPTNGLDPNQIIEIRNLIRELGKKITVIVSSHVMQEVEAICDRVLIIHEGRLVAQGTTSEIASQLRGEERCLGAFYIEGSREIADIQKSLQEHAQIESVTALRHSDAHGQKQVYEFEVILSERGDDVGGAALFHWAVSEKAVLTALNFDTLKLEEIFVRLTQ